MNAELDALATALYVTVDDLLIDHPELRPERPAVGITPILSDAELVTMSTIQALLGFTSEARFIRYAHTHLRHLFPYVPDRPGYNKRLRHAADLLRHVIRALATSCSAWCDNVWLLDSTPVECARSRETVKRSNLAGAAGYGYCASHSRFFWGFRLHLIATPTGLPIAFALANPKEDERVIARDMLETDPTLLRAGQTVLADKGYRSAEFDAFITSHGAELIRPTYGNDTPAPGSATSNHSARPSNRSTKPSKPNSTSNATPPAPSPESPPASSNESSPSPPPSGTTNASNTDHNAPSPPTTTNHPTELLI